VSYTILQAAEIISQGMEISPYNAAGYGAVVVVLGLLCWYFADQLKRERKEHSQFKERSLTVLIKAEEKLPTASEFTEIKMLIHQIIEYVRN
tara:strand:- start:349 stop:624 length:276 start_codon:yes stop_codon:yes gene_type:complete